MGFSQVGVTDLPLTAAFSAAMLLALPWIGKRDGRYLAAAGASLGLAVLAKGLLPLVLAAPVALRLRWFRDLLRPRVVAPFVVVALPWYVLCYARNGARFLHEFFVVHHFERFTAGGLLHVQPWWFYLPMLPALLLPWAPLLPAAGRGREWREPRRLFLLLWAGFGLVFFSASRNKLPGYLLPLMPAVAILMGLGIERGRAESGARAGYIRSLLAACALLLAAYVVAAPLLPAAIANTVGQRAATGLPLDVDAAAASGRRGVDAGCARATAGGGGGDCGRRGGGDGVPENHGRTGHRPDGHGPRPGPAGGACMRRRCAWRESAASGSTD